ncbi:hypothetical protein KAU11_03875 [Candidatus Babeliales bacterium]|nr:hypothetical protein [Candidatus Babeliales bacterium]
MKFYKFAGRSIGLALMALAFMWSPNPESGALMLFFGSVLVLLGVAKTEKR